ncbi:Phosphorylated adapter RNA export protein [Aphelenchoides fujianensis]|nr:Phosphorylated adapter RNA export protein [Aphelenchoides fujianensis]
MFVWTIKGGNSESPFVVADAAAEFGVVPSKQAARTERNLAPDEQAQAPRTRQYGKRKKTSHFTNVVLRPDFNFERLFAARIPDDLPVVRTAEMIGEALGEVDLVPIKFAVTVVGKRVALELFAATVEQEKAGGLRVKSGFRRRTPGGVFFELLRLREDLHEAIKNQIGGQTEARIQRMHEQKEDLKPLPDAKVVMFDDLDGEEADEMAG